MTPIMMSCEKAAEEPANTTNEYNSQQKIWPWVIAGIITVVGTLSEGQARDVHYYENGNVESYNCMSLGTCHIAISTSGGGGSIGSTDGLYTGDISFSGFEIVSSEQGDVFLRSKLDNPDLRNVFYDKQQWELSMPFTIDNPQILSVLKLNNPVTISGSYNVITDKSENLMYVKLK